MERQYDGPVVWCEAVCASDCCDRSGTGEFGAGKYRVTCFGRECRDESDDECEWWGFGFDGDERTWWGGCRFADWGCLYRDAEWSECGARSGADSGCR